MTKHCFLFSLILYLSALHNFGYPISSNKSFQLSRNDNGPENDIFLLLHLQTTVTFLYEPPWTNLPQLIAVQQDSPAKTLVQPAPRYLITVRPSPWIKTLAQSPLKHLDLVFPVRQVPVKHSLLPDKQPEVLENLICTQLKQLVKQQKLLAEQQQQMQECLDTLIAILCRNLNHSTMCQ